MTTPLRVDLFAEDRAHEQFIKPLLARLALEAGRAITLRVRSARGGRGRAISELKVYQQSVMKGIGLPMPDLLIVAIDANCKKFAAAQRRIDDALEQCFRDRTIKATPDPHVERWLLADLETFSRVVGACPSLKSGKCEPNYYKNMLAQAVMDAGFPPTLGGIEFAEELVAEMDLFRAGQNDSSFRHFVDEVRGRFSSL